ncbi:ThiF family adenylyltransferase [Phocicoccus pinnipedialis]|uniref:Molybdopterin-synthase adenylyltransferase n=1 Tax=Phocicoccus pinnipedialis TaxID=110845 RepID=A0A6V7R0I1_9BACL|nr:ThiF family adenylyltransferase [Jeotgalicoccus pinnipedialis]MBP1938740.1 adenylyltransferase/sulfurtransferase [Jeotgalicoccus pinnipedialis]CAD2070588.1 Molybdopterin-synthase adenylyltransferase [Jeotgalicoccus pinnipedialis]
MDRYSRQILFRAIGEEGQAKLKEKTVMIVGVGALGSVSSEMLARAGIKKLVLVDRDYVEASNLQRQSLFNEQDAADKNPKVVAAKAHLSKIRSDLDIDIHIAHADAQFLDALVQDVDLIMDGTDNFETRLVINDVAFKHNIPFCHAAVVEGSYTSATFIPNETPCYRCLTPVLPSKTMTCDTAGVIAPAVHMAVSTQVAQAMKVMTNTSLDPVLIFGNVWDLEQNQINFKNIVNKDCSTCQKKEYPTYNEHTNLMQLCGRDTVQITDKTITKERVKFAIDTLGSKHRDTPYFLEFYFETYRIVVFDNGRMLIHGVENEKKARTIISQLLG